MNLNTRLLLFLLALISNNAKSQLHFSKPFKDVSKLAVLRFTI